MINDKIGIRGDQRFYCLSTQKIERLGEPKGLFPYTKLYLNVMTTFNSRGLLRRRHWLLDAIPFNRINQSTDRVLL